MYQRCWRYLILLICVSFFVGQKPAFAQTSDWKTPQESVGTGLLLSAEDTLQVRLTYLNGTLSIKSALVQKGYVPKEDELAKGYTLYAKDGNGKVVESKKFSPPLQVFSLPPLTANEKGNGGKKLSDTEFLIVLPWSTSIQTLEVRDASDKLVTVFKADRLQHVATTQSFRSKRGSEVKKMKTQSSNNVLQAQSASDIFELTFIGHGYTTDQMNTFVSDVNRFVNLYITLNPFYNFADNTIFYYVLSTADLGCTYSGRLLTCNNATVESVVRAAGAPYDKLVVIVNNPTYGGSGGQNVAVTYNGDLAPQAFMHELGHTLSQLVDEYLLNDPAQPLNKNCFNGTPPNPAWSGIVGTSSYFQECNFASYYRSSQDSIMRTITTTNFNPISIHYLDESLRYYTGQATPSPTSTPTRKQGDANDDGRVDGADYVIWAGNYGKIFVVSPGVAGGDFNGDGKVDGVDYSMWIGNYGR